MTADPATERRWLKRFDKRGPRATTVLLCFPHAGGSAGMFRHWPELLPDSVEPVAVQLPGRADRFREPAYSRLDRLLDDLADVLDPWLRRPFACYGASMGARLAWALAHTLRARGRPGPDRIYVAASSAPALDNGRWPWQGHADGLEGYIRDLGGTPGAVLAEPALMAALLPTMRADLELLSTSGFRPAAPLDVPIHAFAGRDDDEATPERMGAWRTETSARFDLDVVAAGHFFDAAAERRVTGAIGRELGPSPQEVT